MSIFLLDDLQERLLFAELREEGGYTYVNLNT